MFGTQVVLHATSLLDVHIGHKNNTLLSVQSKDNMNKFVLYVRNYISIDSANFSST